MALSETKRGESLIELLNLKALSGISEQQYEVIFQVNELAAEADIVLSRQSATLMNILIREVQSLKEKNDFNVSAKAAEIFQKINKKFEMRENERLHAARGHFDTEKLTHKNRKFRCELEDHDMANLMPKSSNNTAVFAQLDREQPTDPVPALQDGIEMALENDDIHHLMFAIGPRHWRGVYITKPHQNNAQYHVEIFDPFGPESAREIKEYVTGLLKKCHISPFDLHYTGPGITQQDGYACGDFTCAYSHKKIKEFDKNSQYNQKLINALEKHGNKDDALRQVSRDVTDGYEPIVERKAVQVPHEKKSMNTSQKQQASKAQLTDAEKKVIEATIPKQDKAAAGQSSEYKILLQGLMFAARQGLFSKVEKKIAIKDIDAAQAERGEDDEAFAIRLQEAEFRKAGLKR